MAISSKQIGWGTESNLLWQILKQLNHLTNILFGLKETATPKYKVYTAIITAFENDTPVVIELENTIGTITFNKFDESVGRYRLISDFLFTENKTVLFYGSIGREDNYVPNPQLISNWDSTNAINLYTFLDGVESNLVIWKTSIEIRVYS
jgi:hypothetical protein